jgi:hypothetical protein
VGAPGNDSKCASDAMATAVVPSMRLVIGPEAVAAGPWRPRPGRSQVLPVLAGSVTAATAAALGLLMVLLS